MKQLEEEGLEFLALDVDSEESIRAAKETVEKKYGRLDALINNAAIHLDVISTYNCVLPWQLATVTLGTPVTL